MNSQNSTERERNLVRWFTLCMVAVMAFVCSVTMLGVNAPRAQAATIGTGIDFDSVGYLGSFELANGEHAYCVEIKVWEPWASQDPVQTVSSLPAFEGDLMIGSMLGMGGVELEMPAMTDAARMRQMNYILTTWGATDDGAQAAAVALAMFAVRGDPIGYNAALQEEVIRVGGKRVVDRAHAMVAEAQTRAIAPIRGEAASAPTLTVNHDGNGMLEYGQGTHTLSLTNAVFVVDGTSTMQVDQTTAGSVEIQGVKPAGWDARYEISATSQWSSGRDGWKAELQLHAPTKPTEQRIATPTGMTAGFALSGSHEVSTSVHNSWAPAISTEVISRVLEVGDRFVDRVTVEADEQWGVWSTDSEGSHMPLRFEGTLYGPLDADPSLKPMDEAPADAPVAAITELNVVDGPGTYTVTAPGAAYRSGYYTWVWRAHWEDQAEEVISPVRTRVSSLNHAAFPVSDGYGLKSETHLVKQRLTITTRLASGEVGLGWSLIDDVSVAPEAFGGWLTDIAGERIPVRLRGTVYHSLDEPVQSASVPEVARPVGETFLTVSDAGIHESNPVPLPLDSEGFVTMRWCILDEDQEEPYRGVTREWCDDYGVSAETSAVTAPRVSTIAQPDAEVGDTIVDEALVEGLVPNESELFFTAYLYPEVGDEKYTEDWEATGEQWSAEELESMSETERCVVQPVVATTPQAVIEAGTHLSPEVLTKSAGKIHWVETLQAVDPTTGSTEIIHEGECGIVNETTMVSPKPDPEPATDPELATTGSVAQGAGVGGIAIVLFLTGVGLMMNRRRERQY